jgi:hypothetical protein|tara:strand:- start:545 stop:727 length:183 start_codon:yes stop_codon:yes gene_type:complete
MQLKFKQQNSLRQTLTQILIKVVLVFLVIFVSIFVLDRINFPSPKNEIKKDITNEIIKLK